MHGQDQQAASNPDKVMRSLLRLDSVCVRACMTEVGAEGDWEEEFLQLKYGHGWKGRGMADDL